MDILESLPDYVIGFEPWEVKSVIENYVCPVCHGALVAFDIPYERIYIIVCPEHGNVELIGRIRRESVDIQMESEHRDFGTVIRNLDDLWGELIPPKRTEQENLRDLGF